jgi:hypothetical protein
MGAEVKGLRAAHEAVGKFCGNKYAANGVALGLANAHPGRVSRLPLHGTILPPRRRGTEETLQGPAQHLRDHDEED